MGTTLMRTVFGLSIAAGSLVMAKPASATVWKNFANESFCLGVAAGNMTPGTQLIIWQCDGSANQSWGQVSAPWNSNYVQLWDFGAPQPPNSQARCAGTSGGSINNGTNIIIWSCNTATQSHDQGWHPWLQGYDFSGHACYEFVNELAQEHPFHYTKVLGVSGGVMTNGRPVILWDDFTSGHNDQIWCAY